MNCFPTLQRVNLEEYASNSEFEKYTSIVLDKEDNAFKVVTGQFHDKRDAYEKLSARGMIVRKTFESKIWKWIENNAPNNLTAYLMFSTAFSKWKGNNILNDYYVKLLNDIPELNREKIKGDPNSMALDKVQRESVLQEVKADDKHYEPNFKGTKDSHKLTNDEKIANIKIDQLWDQYTRLKNLTIYPLNTDGTASKMATPLTIKQTYAAKDPAKGELSEEDFIDPDLLKPIFNNVYIRHGGEAFPKWATFPFYVIADEDGREIGKITKTRLPDLLKQANAKESEAISKVLSGAHNPDLALDKDALNNFITQYKVAKANGDTKVASKLLHLIKNTNTAKQREPGDKFDMAAYKACEEVRDAISQLSTAIVNKDDSFTVKDVDKVIDKKVESIENTLNSANEFEKAWASNYKELQTTRNYLAKAKDQLDSGEKTQDTARKISQDLKGIMSKILERGNETADATSAQMRLKAGDYNSKQRHADLHSDPRMSPSNPIRGGDLTSRFINKLGNINHKPNSLKDHPEYNSKIKPEDDIRYTSGLNKSGQLIDQISELEKRRDELKAELDNIANSAAFKALNDKLVRTHKTPFTNQVYKASILPNILANLTNEPQTNNNIKDEELASIYDSLSDKDKALLTKYAKLKKDFSVIHNHELPRLNRAVVDQGTGLDRLAYDLKTQKTPLKKESVSVNQGAETAYLTTPKQPQMNTTAAVPMAGTIVEGEKQFNPELFDGYQLKKDVRDALLKIAYKFEDKLDLQLEPVDIYLTGSNANYNYNNASDIDLHLVYDYEDVGAAAEIFKRYLIAQKKVFNSDYDIYVKGIKVEVGAEDINNPLVAGGVYSVKDDEWKLTPEQMPDEETNLPPYMTEVINEIEQAIQSQDSEIIGNLWKALGELRKASLADEGEFGSGNLMFKKLRADGYLERLKDAYYNNASKELSLESLEEI